MAGAAQLPVGDPPEQNEVGVKVLPLQVADAQLTLVGCCWQSPAPVQRPVLPQVPFAEHLPCGSATLAPTMVQVPALPVTLQERQVPQLGLPQQTPSTQLALPHSWLERQATPSDLTGRQAPAAPVQ